MGGRREGGRAALLDPHPLTCISSPLEQARKAFERAAGGAQSVADTEVDVADFFRREAKRSLDVTKQKLAAAQKK